MTRKCILCEQVFGCKRGSIKYECEACRLADGCGIRLFFITNDPGDEVCESCWKIIEKNDPVISAKLPNNLL